MGAERRRNLDPKIETNHRDRTTRMQPSTNGSHSRPPVAADLPVRRLYSRHHAFVSLLFWAGMVAVFTPLAVQFTSRIQTTLSGMKGRASETVRQNVVKNFSTALAFPTAVVWDAAGQPQADSDAAWSSLLDALRADPQVNEVTDGNTMIENWPRSDWHAAFVAVNATTYGDAEHIVPGLRDDVTKLTFPGGKKPWVTGGPALFLDLNVASTDSLRSGELIALP